MKYNDVIREIRNYGRRHDVPYNIWAEGIEAEVDQLNVRLNAWKDDALVWERRAALFQNDLQNFQKYSEQEIESVIKEKDDEIEKLRLLLSEARDEIVEYVESEYPPDMMEYPSVRVAVEMDMDLVYRIDEALENKDE
jgi:hypothetical protein